MPGQHVIDGRDMVPPEPLDLALAVLPGLQEGEELVMLLRCEPLPLYSILERGGYAYESSRREDGTTEVRIRKAPAGTGP